MSCRILHDDDQQAACFYDSVTDWAFGPVFIGDDAQEQAEAFEKWLGCDPRRVSLIDLGAKYNEWREVCSADRTGR